MKINENQKVTLTLGQLKRLVRESITSEKSEKVIARFYGDGMEPTTDTFSDKEDFMREVNSMAYDHDGTVRDYGDEVVVMNGNGQEVGRWEILSQEERKARKTKRLGELSQVFPQVFSEEAPFAAIHVFAASDIHHNRELVKYNRGTIEYDRLLDEIRDLNPTVVHTDGEERTSRRQYDGMMWISSHYPEFISYIDSAKNMEYGFVFDFDIFDYDTISAL